jgi:hypothetical protein
VGNNDKEAEEEEVKRNKFEDMYQLFVCLYSVFEERRHITYTVAAVMWPGVSSHCYPRGALIPA